MSNISNSVSYSGGFSISQEGVAELPNGEQVDLTTAEGLAQAEEVLDPGALLELKAVMAGLGYKLKDGSFVANDTFGIKTENKYTGGSEGDVSPLDQEVAGLYAELGEVCPFNPATTNALFKQVGGTTAFADAKNALSTAINNPTPENIAAANKALLALAGGKPNAMELLYLVMRESIRENNEDKKYFLMRLQEMNKLAQGLSDYLKDLQDASADLASQVQGGADQNKATTAVEVQEFNLSTLDAQGQAVNMKEGSTSVEVGADLQRLADKSYGGDVDKTVQEIEAAGSYADSNLKEQAKQYRYTSQDVQHTGELKFLNREGLNAVTKQVEADQETLRNMRQMIVTRFQNFDQKGNQYMNILSTLTKTINEMRGIGASSRSGL